MRASQINVLFSCNQLISSPNETYSLDQSIHKVNQVIFRELPRRFNHFNHSLNCINIFYINICIKIENHLQS